MPAGLPYFAWIDASETTFGPEHLRWDESVFSFTLKQDEGDPANLTAIVRRPHNEAGNSIGLLGPGRKIWVWFALDCGPALIKFHGRLVGIPTSIFEELVTLEFVGRPSDVVAQKEALAATLRVLPYYDEVVLDEARRKDPDVVLEGYTKIWHYDRETNAITVSDEIQGEDGTVEFDGTSDGGKVFYDGLGLTLTSGPLARVDFDAEFTWTQQATGTVDLTNYLTSHWPGAVNGVITSYSLSAGDWPKNGASIGDGWKVAEATAYDYYDPQVSSRTEGGTSIVEFSDGSGARTTFTETRTVVTNAPYLLSIGAGEVTSDESSATMATDGDGNRYATSTSRNYSGSEPMLVGQSIKPTLVAGYDAKRQFTERVSFTLFADVQSIMTDPEDGEALRVDDVRSVNLTEPIDGTIPIGDPRRRSYIATERGNQSIEHLIALARAHLMKRARAVEITFAPKLARMPEITLRKNALLLEPRVGEALGKIIYYSVALDGEDGRINCEVRIGCTIGRGGSALANDGTPSYCTIDYTGSDYQQFINRVLIAAFEDSSVGYQPPNADPNDDGIDFLSVVRVEDVIERGLVVEYGPDEQKDGIEATIVKQKTAVTTEKLGNNQSASANQADYLKNAARQFETRGTFKLKSMTREFSTDYELQVTDLKIPVGYDLEAV